MLSWLFGGGWGWDVLWLVVAIVGKASDGCDDAQKRKDDRGKG
jgi:hypothetical protein